MEACAATWRNDMSKEIIIAAATRTPIGPAPDAAEPEAVAAAPGPDA